MLHDKVPKILVLCCCLALAARADEPQRPTTPDTSATRVDQQIVRLVRDHFFDAKRASAWAEAHQDYGKVIDDPAELARTTNQKLLELKASHTAYYTPREVAYYGLLAIFREPLKLKESDVAIESIGADFTSDHFIRTLFAGGPAESSGLKRGDRILAAGDRPFDPIQSFRGQAGKRVVLLVERTKGARPLQVPVIPRRIDPRAEWHETQKQGARIITREGRSVAYMPLFMGGGEEPRRILQEAIIDQFRQADALILDFRNGWGGSNPDFVNLFNPVPPILTMINREGGKTSFDSQWRKPLLILINSGTRSGKEVVAHTVKRHHLGTLIGERTAGAVLAGRPFLLHDRSLLFLATADVMIDGTRLEGVGVAPDVVVTDQLPYADGSDIQLERAIQLAVQSSR